MKKTVRLIPLFLVLTVVSALAFYSLHLYTTLQTLAAENIQLEQLADTRQTEISDLQRQLEELRKASTPQQPQQPQQPTKPAKTAYLTFDDGPSQNTPQVLDILKRYQVKATFFVNANTSELGQEMYQRILAEGHALGNHGYSHDYAKVYQSTESYLANIKQLDDLLYQVTGQRPRLTRFLGGSKSGMAKTYGGPELIDQLIPMLTAQGFQYFDWNVSSLDATSTTPDKQIIVNGVIDGVRGKDKVIVLMHDGAAKSTTVEALPAIIEHLRSQGYTFQTLSDSSFAYHFSR